MSILLQIPRHRRNHSQHVLNDVIPPLEQLVSDSFTPRLFSLSAATKWIYTKTQQLKTAHITTSFLWVRNLAESPNSEDLKKLQSEFEPELVSHLKAWLMCMVIGRFSSSRAVGQSTLLPATWAASAGQLALSKHTASWAGKSLPTGWKSKSLVI